MIHRSTTPRIWSVAIYLDIRYLAIYPGWTKLPKQCLSNLWESFLDSFISNQLKIWPESNDSHAYVTSFLKRNSNIVIWFSISFMPIIKLLRLVYSVKISIRLLVIDYHALRKQAAAQLPSMSSTFAIIIVYFCKTILLQLPVFLQTTVEISQWKSLSKLGCFFEILTITRKPGVYTTDSLILSENPA